MSIAGHGTYRYQTHELASKRSHPHACNHVDGLYRAVEGLVYLAGKPQRFDNRTVVPGHMGWTSGHVVPHGAELREPPMEDHIANRHPDRRRFSGSVFRWNHAGRPSRGLAWRDHDPLGGIRDGDPRHHDVSVQYDGHWNVPRHLEHPRQLCGNDLPWANQRL
jgi:hypothetical protein